MKPEDHLNIISFDIPYPPDYGGIIDVYFKIKALADIGIKLHCHFFQYKDRRPSKQLENICEKVYYYKRNRFKNPFISGLPYIVKTRKSKSLLENLNNNNYTILFEGLHSCLYLNNPSLRERIKIVRMHNIEHIYYFHLAKKETNIMKKAFFHNEGKNLRKYLDILNYTDKIAAISLDDAKYLNVKFPDKTFYLPVFHPNNRLKVEFQKSNFALYNGNLSVNENTEAALYLINHVFSGLDINLVIAGKNPPKELVKTVSSKNNIKLIGNPDDQTMQRLLTKAQIHVLPTFQNTGAKLKLINTLFYGKHVIVNPPMVENTDLKDLCLIANNANEMKKLIISNMDKVPDKELIKKREQFLLTRYSNIKNAKKLIENIY